jgi:hypothetical protein
MLGGVGIPKGIALYICYIHTVLGNPETGPLQGRSSGNFQIVPAEP